MILNHGVIIGTALFITTLNTLSFSGHSQINFWEVDRYSLSKVEQLKSKKPILKKRNSPMNKVVISQPLMLQAWQEDPNLPPAGVPPNKERPIGYGLLRVTFENKTMQTITLHLKKLEVHPAGNQNKLMSLPSVDLTLRPLEISPQQYRLTNKEGYGNVKQVKGVIIYELDGQSYALNSPIVNIN